jgi:hypothetical protein
MIGVLGVEYCPIICEKVILLIFIDTSVHVPGPGIFSAYGGGGFTLPLKE